VIVDADVRQVPAIRSTVRERPSSRKCVSPVASNWSSAEPN
jgi:hypothetical protein